MTANFDSKPNDSEEDVFSVSENKPWVELKQIVTEN